MTTQNIPEAISTAVINMLAPYMHITHHDLVRLADPVPEAETDELMTRFEVRDALKVSLPTVDRMIRDGTLEGVKIRRRMFISEGSVKTFLNSARVCA